MKRILCSVIVIGLVAAAPVVSVADVFFSDDFSTSTVNQVPVAPTAGSASYEIIAWKNYSPAPSIASGDLKFGMVATSGGIIEAQAVFANSPITLVVPGDYIEMTVVFTNTAGLLTALSYMGFGLYDSGQVFPVAGGITNNLPVIATGGAQNWRGYWAQLGYTGNKCKIVNRKAQTGTDNRNQEVLTTGSGGMSYGSPAGVTVGSEPTAPSLTLVAGQPYTASFKIAFVDDTTLAITNTIYAGAEASGTPLSQFGGLTTSTTWVTGGFDALGIGWYQKTGSIITTIDISSIVISGHATPITGPPDITSQPSPVSVPAGAAAALMVEASGYSMSYQWHRYGTNLVDGGNISGANRSMLVISPASADDVASGANGYYVTVSGAGGYSTNSTTVPLSLRAAASLTWSGSGSVWDLNTTANWLSGASPAVFNFGDNVTFDDTGAANLTVNLEGQFLSASSVTVNGSAMVDYVFSGTGSFAGPGRLDYIGSGFLTLNNANSYSGGTLISNANAYLVLNNYNGLGSGPVTLGKAGGNMEIVNAGGASLGIKGDIIVADDFNITYDATSAYGAVFLGNLSGTAGKTLALTLNPSATGVSRVRVYGGSTVCDANLNLVDFRTVFAAYSASGSQTYNGVISGAGAFMQKGTTTYLNGANTYSGGTFPATGTIGLGRNSVGDPVTSGPIGTGPLLLAPDSTTTTTGSGTILAWAGARTIANPVQYPSATNNQTLIIGGTNNLTLSGPITLNGDDGVTPVYTNRTFQVDNTALTTFSGVISDGGANFGLTKTGNGVLALNNVETYTGPTTVSSGTLQVNGQLAAASAVTVAMNAILAGTGTIGGSVTVNAGGAIAPGTSIGTLNIGGDLSLAGNLNLEVNRAGLASDKISVGLALNNTGTGTVTVTNLGAALQVGDKFTLFNKSLGNGSALSVTGANVTWANNLDSDGSISVLAVMATTPTNISYSLSGANLTLSWPANYLGWILQSNSVGVTAPNWFDVPNSQNATQFIVTPEPAKPNVFYRLLRP